MTDNRKEVREATIWDGVVFVLTLPIWIISAAATEHFKERHLHDHSYEKEPR